MKQTTTPDTKEHDERFYIDESHYKKIGFRRIPYYPEIPYCKKCSQSNEETKSK